MVFVNAKGERIKGKEKWKVFLRFHNPEVLRSGNGDKVGLYESRKDLVVFLEEENGWQPEDII